MLKGRVEIVALVGLILALGAGALGSGGFDLYRVRRIEAGPVVEGRATAWDVVELRRSTQYKVKYEFARDGEPRTGDWARVTKQTHDTTRAGAPLPVRYAAERPDWHLPEAALKQARTRAGLTVLAGVVVLVFPAFPLMAAWVARRAKAKRDAGHFPKAPPPGSP